MRAAPLLLALAAMALLCGPALDPETQLYFRDTGRLYYPVKRYIAERLAHGELALWYPGTEAGTSILAQVTPGLLHPLTLLYLLPFDLAFKLNHLLALPLAAAGLYLFARRLGASPWASSAGAIAYGGSGYLLSMASSNLPFALGAASAPWALFGLLWFLERPGAIRLGVASLLLAGCAYVGDPQWMLFAGVIGAAWAFASAAVRGPAAAARGALHAGLWGLVALLLSAPVAWPAAARLVQTSRFAGIARRDSGRYATDPRRLPGLLVPIAFDDGGDLAIRGKLDPHNQFQEMIPNSDGVTLCASITLGAPAVLFALLAVRRRRGRFLLLGALVFGLAATGNAFGVHDWLGRLPVFRYFRYAEKFIGPVSLLLSAAAALGADFALAGGKRAAVALAAVAGGAAALLLGAAAAGQLRFAAMARWLAEGGATHNLAIARSFGSALVVGLEVAGALALALALLGVLRAYRPRGSFAILAALACAASILVSAHDALPTAPIELFRGPFPLAEELVRRAGPSKDRWRLYTQGTQVRIPPIGPPQLAREVATAQALMPQYEVLADLEGVSSYFTATDEEYAEAMVRFPSRLFPALNVRFALFGKLDLQRSMAARKGFVGIGKDFWLKDFGESQRAYLVDGALALTRPEMVAQLGDRNFDTLRTALLESPAAPIARRLLPAGTGKAGSVTEEPHTPERRTLRVDALREALLVVSMHFDRGWRALVDGAPVKAERVDMVVLGVPVPPGAHRVDLRFEPEGFRGGLWIFGATLAALAGFAFRERRA